MKTLAAAFLACFSMLALPAEGASRIKDIATISAARDNQLIGYGLVIGLQGSGDSLRNSPFTEQATRSMLEKLGISTDGGSIRAKNIAAVIVSARLPPFARQGVRFDVSVSSLGDATSLRGGNLIMTPLVGADGEIYGVAQGPVIVSGFSAQGAAETVTAGVPTAGRIPDGAIVEREIPELLSSNNTLTLQLRNQDFSTVVAITDAINAQAKRRFGRAVARELDSGNIVLRRPEKVSTARFIAVIENIPVETDAPARVVIDERTGTIVIGQEVKVSRVAVSHGTLTVRISETPLVSQPDPFSDGETVVTPLSDVQVGEGGGQVALVEGPSLRELVAGLNRIGVKPGGIIAILQTIKTAGALQAELVVQ